MSRFGKRFSQVLPVVVALLSVTLTVMVFHFHIYTLRVLSNSMQPNLNPGDLAIVREIPTKEVSAGMVILGVRPNTHDAFLHRVISSEWDGRAWVLRTRGDANPEPDAWTLVVGKPTVPLLMGRIPLGVLGQKLPAARSAFGWLAALLITANVVWELSRRRSRHSSHRHLTGPLH